jgi:hypothetical protein
LYPLLNTGQVPFNEAKLTPNVSLSSNKRVAFKVSSNVCWIVPKLIPLASLIGLVALPF